ncbi:MAG: hypothetical protein PVI90_00300 [Desulfobacteraceae bacterium]|jgi:hypothetical protein
MNDNKYKFGDMIKRFKKRQDVYSKALLEAPYKTPGESIMPIDAQEFINKRAALQQTTKVAAPLPKGAKNIVSTILAHPGRALLIGGSLFELSRLAGPTLETLGKRIQKRVVPTMRERENLDEEAATAFAHTVGNELGSKAVGLLSDVISKAVQAPAALWNTQARASVFKTLQQEDDVISQADPQQLAEAYHTMVRFAPTLATDKNAVKTFLRESTLYGTGPNFVSIKQLADAEKAVTTPTNISKR